MLNKFFLYLFISFVFVACSDEYTLIHEDIVTVNKNKLRDDSLLRDTILNFNFSRLAKPNSYGLESAFKVSDEFRNKKLRIIFRGKGRTAQVYTNSSITIAILTGDSNKVLIWKAMSLKYAYTDVNKWCWFQDSIELGESYLNKTYSYIDVSSCLGNTLIEKFDMDTLIVQIKAKL